MRILSFVGIAAGIVAATSLSPLSRPASAGSKVHGSSEACLALLAHSGADPSISPKSGKRNVRVGNQAAYQAAVRECYRRRDADVKHVIEKSKKHSERRFRENKEFAEDVLGLKAGKHGKGGHGGHGKKFKPGFF